MIGERRTQCGRASLTGPVRLPRAAWWHASRHPRLIVKSARAATWPSLWACRVRSCTACSGCSCAAAITCIIPDTSCYRCLAWSLQLCAVALLRVCGAVIGVVHLRQRRARSSCVPGGDGLQVQRGGDPRQRRSRRRQGTRPTRERAGALRVSTLAGALYGGPCPKGVRRVPPTLRVSPAEEGAISTDALCDVVALA